MASIDGKNTPATGAGSPIPSRQRATADRARQEVWTGDLILVSGVATLVWVILLVLTPPGSFDYALSPLQRLAFFAGLGAVCWPLGHALAASLLHIARLRSPVALGVATITAGAYLAANLCAVALALEELFLSPAPDELTTGEIYLLCAVVATSHVGLLYFVAWQRAKLKLSRARAPEPAVPASAPPVATDSDTGEAPRPAQSPAAPAALPAAALHARFLNRLPQEVGRDLVYIKGMGHYLNVVTTSGSASVLMRFTDAILELGEIGLRVHRSYWVAHRHITRVVRRNGHALVRLSNGDEVPVSRTYQVAVSKAQGLSYPVEWGRAQRRRRTLSLTRRSATVPPCSPCAFP